MKDYTGTIASGTLKQHVKYEYDTFNRRVARWVDTNGNGTSDREEFYVYDGDDVALDFVDANGATGGVSPVLKTRYLQGPAVDQILAQEELEIVGGTLETADVLWMLTDHLGSVRDIVNQEGEAVSHVTYDAFGNIVGGTGVLLTRYLYTGRELDTLTGLQYNRNRWYDPTLGRWISEDPIGFWGGDYNLQRYVANEPTYWIDPTGLGKARIVIQIVKRIPGIGKPVKVGKPLVVTPAEAAKLVREGTDITCESGAAAKRVAQAAGEGGKGKAIRHNPHPKAGDGARPHYHGGDHHPGWGHVFYSVTAYGTLEYWAEGQGTVTEWGAFILDIFNPLALPNDVVSIYQFGSELICGE